MPAEGLPWMPAAQALDDDEMMRLIRLGVEKLGIRQVRFTGGESLLRRSLEILIERTNALRTDEGKAPQTTLTTNTLGIDKRAQRLKDAGVDGMNVSLDTVDEAPFAPLTRHDRLSSTIAGLDKAHAVGLTPVKVNTVVMPGINEGSINQLATFCLERGFQLHFIEQIPLGAREEWTRDDMFTAEDIFGNCDVLSISHRRRNPAVPHLPKSGTLPMAGYRERSV